MLIYSEYKEESTHLQYIHENNTVEYATMNECYNKQFSAKSGCYNERRCYNGRGGILSADVAQA